MRRDPGGADDELDTRTGTRLPHGSKARLATAQAANSSHDCTGNHICSSPASSLSEISAPSMAAQATGHVSPTATTPISRLVLEPQQHSHHDRTTSKRRAELDLSPASSQNKRYFPGPHGSRRPPPLQARHPHHQSSRCSHPGKILSPSRQMRQHPHPKDSGNEFFRRDSIDSQKSQITPGSARQEDQAITGDQGTKPRNTKSKYPGLILEPDASPISQDQLAAEVKGIYSGLVMVEAKCINIDAAQAADPKSNLGPEQWQALIALHRTLLYEHHDFLMATQHPSANDSLKGLATKYSMPARMWKHGIHAFLEVLRYRRPESQDYMLAFIYLAYQMMALLFETVESFKDTWIECLGDLARYRMAIEEDREAHATWGGVAARWYTLANDRHPAIGRLNHHLGILERPSLRKMCFYAKALTCVLPFHNAKDSLATLCSPMLYDDELMRSSNQPAEARIMYFQAMAFTGYAGPSTVSARDEALALLRQESSGFIHRVGVPLAITNIAALFEYGSQVNALRAIFAHAISQKIQYSRPSAVLQAPNNTTAFQDPFASTKHTFAIPTALELCYASFEFGLQQTDDLSAIQDVSPFVHVMMSWLHGVISLRPWISARSPLYNDMDGALIGASNLPWGSLALFLNTLIVYYPLADRVIQCADRGVFLQAESQNYHPLQEDYMTRGLVWLHFYTPTDWFDGKLDEDSRHVETDATRKMRAERIQWLGLVIARNTRHLRFDSERQRFSAVEGGCGNDLPSSSTTNWAVPQQMQAYTTTPPLKSTYPVGGSQSPSSATLSAMSETGVDSTPDSWANIMPRSKRTGIPVTTPSSFFHNAG